MRFEYQADVLGRSGVKLLIIKQDIYRYAILVLGARPRDQFTTKGLTGG